MRSRMIQAFFAGKCRCCGKSVAKGDQVYFAKHYGVRCLSCGPHTADDQPLPSKRSKKAKSAASSPSAPTPSVRKAPKRFASRLDDKMVTSLGDANFVPFYTPADHTSRLPAEAGPDGVHRLGWTAVSELVEDAFTDHAQNDDAREYLRRLHETHAHSTWANGHDESSIRRALVDPPAHLIQAIEQMRQELIGSLDLPTTPRRKVRRGLDWGDELSADQWLARNPNGWERSVRESQPRRTVTIGVNLTVYWSQEPEELIYRGAAACALADLLTEQGVNVRILGFSVGSNCSSTVGKLVSTIELKAPDMPLDVASLAMAICEVGFFRMVVMPAEFRHLRGRVSHSLGTRGAQYLPGADRKALDYLVESRVRDRSAATAWLHEQIESEVAHV